jgi:hypothetical protein
LTHANSTTSTSDDAIDSAASSTSTATPRDLPRQGFRHLPGHSVAMLLQIHAQVIAGMEDSARKRIDDALGWSPDQDTPGNLDA